MRDTEVSLFSLKLFEIFRASIFISERLYAATDRRADTQTQKTSSCWKILLVY